MNRSKNKHDIVVPESKIWNQTDIPIICHMYTNEVVQ